MDESVASHQLTPKPRVGDHYLLLDHACGRCPSCEEGWTVWCEQPTAGQPLCWVPAEHSPSEVSSLLEAVSAFLSARVESKAVVLAIAPEGGVTILDALTLVHSGPVLLASDPRDPSVKSRLAGLNEAGRADAVVSLRSGRDAVRAVKRGGTVCLPDTAVEMPTVTELAQREVRLVGPRDLAELVKKVGRQSVEQLFERKAASSLPLR